MVIGGGGGGGGALLKFIDAFQYQLKFAQWHTLYRKGNVLFWHVECKSTFLYQSEKEIPKQS